MRQPLPKPAVTPATCPRPMPGHTTPLKHRLVRQLCLDSAEGSTLPSSPERALLAAIVMQAYQEATRPPRSRTARTIHQEAWEFFTAPGQLEWFCELLDWDPALLRATVLAAKR